ncbi:MAG TPA: metallophosphoesterase, partial [Rheinheimera sp.]|nr:metallophosphoesterase [Rheinheimera sp.]
MARWLLSLILIFAALASGTESLANTKTETVLSDPAVNTVTSVGVQPSVEDGPYAFFSDSEQQLQIKWLCETGVVEKTQPITEAIAPVCAYPREITLHHNQTLEPLLRYQTDTVAVISDIHGQYDLMKKLLSAHAVVNADANWSFGQGHLVVIGDVMDRGDKVTEILWWLYQLEQQAEAAGGKVHLLLGNHE